VDRVSIEHSTHQQPTEDEHDADADAKLNESKRSHRITDPAETAGSYRERPA
jgi:hypothetical protein